MIYFISDLHLDASRPAITHAFYQFLDKLAEDPQSQTEALYILGDFFELWIGDDDDDPFVIDVQKKLFAFSQKNIPVYIMRGNRDFLFGEAFAKNTGSTLIDDPTCLAINDHRLLLMHGDTLCTRDTEYQAFRQQSRHPQWIEMVLSKSLDERRALGQHIRQQSKTMSSRKAEDIMDVSDDAVIEQMQTFKATTMIHGHTHRPNRHVISDTNQEQERIVLGDWDKQAWCLRFDSEQKGSTAFTLNQWDIE